MEDHPDPELGIASDSPDFVNLDTNGDHEYMGVSNYGKWKDVIFALPDDIEAPSLDAIREALKHVRFYAFDSQDV